MEKVSKKSREKIVISTKRIQDLKKNTISILDFKNSIEKLLKETTSKFLEVLFGGAIVLNCSDIHIEPRKESVKIRVRIDGLLQDVISFEKETYEKILSRIKVLSETKLNIVDRPQDGRFSILISSNEKNEGEFIEVRVSILPSEYGESIVLRILNPKSLISMENLGLKKYLLDLFRKEIKKPNGMILVTGPTGSGKTTTLYSFLKEIKKPEIKIITIEDPIEYHLANTTQTQVDPKKGYSFASGLQSIMRQDPDVVLIGEIRNSETCKIAIQAALTGHLVFSTLHTNDAAGTIARLINLEAELSDIGPAVNLIIAQRLVRKVCQKCARLKEIDTETLNEFKKYLKNISCKKNDFPCLSEKTKIPQAQPEGCKECNFTGYKGRTGLYEAFLIDNQIEKAILNKATGSDLEKLAIEKGMITMRQYGLIKVLKGITTIEEIDRITKE